MFWGRRSMLNKALYHGRAVWWSIQLYILEHEKAQSRKNEVFIPKSRVTWWMRFEYEPEKRKQRLSWPQLGGGKRKRFPLQIKSADMGSVYTVGKRGLWVDANTWYVSLSGNEITYIRIWNFDHIALQALHNSVEPTANTVCMFFFLQMLC